MVVKVPYERFEELMEIETRVKVLVEQARTHKTMSLEQMYRILGYSSQADSIRQENEQMKGEEEIETN